MSLLLSYLFSLSGFALLSLAAVTWLLARPRSVAARRAITVVVVYTFASIGVVPWALSRPLVSGFTPFTAADTPPGTVAIVVLAGGPFTVHGRHQKFGALDVSSAARVLEAAHVFRITGAKWIVSSGGAAEGLDTEPGAVTMRDALVHLGVPADRIVLETASLSTRDEAALVAPMLRTLRVVRAVLVTSDIHMRRALGAFRAVGVDAVPALALDPLNSQSRLRWILPTVEGLRFTNDVVHEYAGLLEYGVRGWLRF